jgi:hypothetical protein
MSVDSTKCEWYIQSTELTSIAAGPLRSGTLQMYVNVPPGGTRSSAFTEPAVPSL